MRTFAQPQNHPQTRMRASSHLIRSTTAPLTTQQSEHPVLHAHRALADEAPSRIAPVIQTKLAISTPGDEYEREADRVSERIIRMSEPPRRSCSCGGECAECSARHPQPRLETKRVGSRNPGETAPPIIDDVLRSPGEQLDPSTRAVMETRFGNDFARVRVHTNSRAAESAEALNALAYTVGHHIVFSAGQHRPGSISGQRLLAHELVHVVQQSGGDSSHGESAPPQNISRAPDGLVSRQPPPGKDPKKDTVATHMRQLAFVAGLLDKGRKLTPAPTKNLQDPDTLFHNTVGLLDAGRMTLTVLSPTHYDPHKHFDKRIRFDSQNTKLARQADYPSIPKGWDEGLVEEKRQIGGLLVPRPIPTPTGTPKVERSPERVPYGKERPGSEPEKTKPVPTPTPPQPAPLPPFSPGDVFLFTHGIPITEGEFKNTFVHEGQHVADLNTQLQATSANPKLEQYKSEFRAFWIQPPIPRTGGVAPETPFPAATQKADNSQQVTVSISDPKDCDVCPPPDRSVKKTYSAKTNLKNARQEGIFRRIISKYTDQQFGCCYVFNTSFRDEVDKFAVPEGLNLINSARLLDLHLALQEVQKSVKRSDVIGIPFVVKLKKLEPFDWLFLGDPLSQPFWHALKRAAPDFLHDGVKALAEKAKKRLITGVEIDKELTAK
jgi:hypothetical protein